MQPAFLKLLSRPSSRRSLLAVAVGSSLVLSAITVYQLIRHVHKQRLHRLLEDALARLEDRMVTARSLLMRQPLHSPEAGRTMTRLTELEDRRRRLIELIDQMSRPTLDQINRLTAQVSHGLQDSIYT